MVQNKHLNVSPFAAVEHENFANILTAVPVASLPFAVCSSQFSVFSFQWGTTFPETNTPPWNQTTCADRTHAKSVVVPPPNRWIVGGWRCSGDFVAPQKVPTRSLLLLLLSAVVFDRKLQENLCGESPAESQEAEKPRNQGTRSKS